MERYETYKDSSVEWIGEIPEGWTLLRISGLYDARNEKVSDRDYHPLSVTMQGIVPQLETAAKTQDGDNRKLVRKGDFVINSRSDRRGACGISAYDGSVTLISNVLAPKDQSAMSTRYYSYLFRSEGFADEFYRQGTGIVDDLWSTNWTRMKNILVARPPIAEQECIADYLDARTAEVDALVADCEREVGLLQEYRKAVISEAVTKGLDPEAPMKDSGVEWIGEIPEGWRMTTIGRIGRTSSGATPLRGRDDDYFHDATIPWIRTLDLNGASIFKTSEMITELALENASCSVMPVDTVCVAMYGGAGTIGKCGIMAIPATTNQAVCSIVCNNSMQPRYLLYYLHAIRSEWMRFAAGTRKDPNISQEIVGKMCVLVPPLDIQIEIASRLDAKTVEIDALIAAKQSMADKLREYRRSLISEAVTGKFKVPGV